MGRPLELSGATFGRLLVLDEAEAIRRPSGKRQRMWRCRCACGEDVIVRGESLTLGNTRSCGCWKREVAAEHGKRNRRHGMIDTPSYESWSAMLSRCRRVHAPENRHHGGAGVVVCARWEPRLGGSFENFLSDMGERPKGTTLDRFPDQQGNYEPGNTRWATPAQQAANMSSNVLVELDGELVILNEAARRCGLHPDTLGLRYRRGDRGERLFRPAQHTGRRAWKSQGSEQSSAGSSRDHRRSSGPSAAAT
jgi:hypothetical protein